jgi:hypothetical protein
MIKDERPTRHRRASTCPPSADRTLNVEHRIKKMNVQHRTLNVERRIMMSLRSSILFHSKLLLRLPS